MYTSPNKRHTLRALASYLKDGDCVAIGGGLSWREPMAVLRELIRQGIGNLSLVGSAHGIDVDLLCGAGCVAICAESYVGFEQDFGMAPNYRRACESGQVQARDNCCYTLVQQLRAAIAGLPFMPIRSVRGSDFMSLHPEFKTMRCPFTGEELLLVPALAPDVAIIHAQFGDLSGNLHIDGPPVADILFAQASKIVLATVESIVDQTELTRMGVSIPYFYVTAICEVRYGAHPTACYPFYAYDRPHTSYYHESAGKTRETFRNEYLDTFVHACPEHEQYLAAIGGEEVLRRLSSWQTSREHWMALYG